MRCCFHVRVSHADEAERCKISFPEWYIKMGCSHVRFPITADDDDRRTVSTISHDDDTESNAIEVRGEEYLAESKHVMLHLEEHSIKYFVP